MPKFDESTFEGLWVIVTHVSGQVMKPITGSEKGADVVAMCETIVTKMLNGGYFMTIEASEDGATEAEACGALMLDKILSVDVCTSAKMRRAKAEAAARANGPGLLVPQHGVPQRGIRRG